MSLQGSVGMKFKGRVKLFFHGTMAGPGADLLLEANCDWVKVKRRV